MHSLILVGSGSREAEFLVPDRGDIADSRVVVPARQATKSAISSSEGLRFGNRKQVQKRQKEDEKFYAFSGGLEVSFWSK
jgi:hypothetical protein